MNLIRFKHQKSKRSFRNLIKRYAEELMSKKPSKGFKAISIYKGWQYDIHEFHIKRLDAEIHKQNDLIIIYDIKHNRCNELCINYISRQGNDYDAFIEKLLTI